MTELNENVIWPGLLLERGTAPFEHYIGGKNHSPGADCPNCQKPLVLFLSLDLTDPRFSLLTELKRLPLFYCMRCALCWEPFVYKFRDDGSVSILAVNKGVVNDDEWYEEFDDHLEQFSIKLEPMSITLQTSIDRIMEDRDTPIDDFNVNAELGRPVKVAVDCFNQIGGSPFLFQRPENPVCIHCGTRTSFIATLCNDQRKEINILHKMWSAQIIFYICLNCFSLTVIHSS